MNFKLTNLTFFAIASIILLFAPKISANQYCHFKHIEPGMASVEYVGTVIVANYSKCPSPNLFLANGHVLEYVGTINGVKKYIGHTRTKDCTAYLDSVIVRDKKPGVPEPDY